MNALTRREFFAAAAGATLGAMALPATAPGAAAAPRLRIGACDWSLGKRADSGSFAVAREIGLDGVQLSLGTVEDDMKLRRPEIQHRFKEAARAAGVAIGGIAIGELNNVPYKSDPRTETWVEDSIGVMQALRIKVELLAFFSKGDLREDQQGTDEVIRRLKKIAPKAENAGVVFGIESWLSAEETVRMMDRVGSPAVKMYYDVCNSTVRGYDVPKEIHWLGKERICEFHLKENNALLGHGPVKFEAIRDAILEIGYTGWMQIEGGVPPQGKVVDAYKKNLEFVRTLFAIS